MKTNLSSWTNLVGTRHLTWTLLVGLAAWAQTSPGADSTGVPVLTGDSFPTSQGALIVHPVNHASLVLGWGGKILYVDPVGGAARYADLPRADLILITHTHGDHLDATTILAVRTPTAPLVGPPSVCDQKSLSNLGENLVRMTNGETKVLLGASVEAVPAYNLEKTFHRRGVDNGYVLTFGGKRVYISGDTQGTPELRQLRNIDLAFLCMNLPYTMTVAEAISATREFKPKVVYPYHYRGQGGMSDLAAFKAGAEKDRPIEVRLRNWY